MMSESLLEVLQKENAVLKHQISLKSDYIEFLLSKNLELHEHIKRLAENYKLPPMVLIKDSEAFKNLAHCETCGQPIGE